MHERADTIDTCVIGGSAGSLAALKRLLPALPADLPVAVLLCKHVARDTDLSLADVIAPFSPRVRCHSRS
jgi:two-component system chemotaxis response regulator CheB